MNGKLGKKLINYFMDKGYKNSPRHAPLFSYRERQVILILSKEEKEIVFRVEVSYPGPMEEISGIVDILFAKSKIKDKGFYPWWCIDRFSWLSKEGTYDAADDYVPNEQS